MASINRKNLGKKKKANKRFFKFIFMLIIIITVAGIGILAGTFYGFISSATPITASDLKPNKLTTTIYDSSGNEIAHLKTDENRIWIDYNDIPLNLINAFVAIEDERFWTHIGIDIKRIISAAINYCIPGSSPYGASTITQQLIKNITKDDEYSARRKIQEQWRALQLERSLQKWEILELYLNLIFLGRNTNGIQVAAKTYFDKDVKDLNLAECACIAGITQSPANYDPFEHPEKNKTRQRTVLRKMLELENITQEEYDAANKYELVFKQGRINKTSTHSYFVDQIIEDVVNDLMLKNGVSKEMAFKILYSNGLKIYTTQDSFIQKCMEDVFLDNKYFPKLEGGNELPQGAMVIIDPYNGEVKGIVGGAGEKTADLVLNRATSKLATKHPGSSIKPLAVYAPAIEAGILTSGTVIDDAPLYVGNYHPENYNKKYKGLTTVREAIASSLNVVAVKAWLKLGAQKSVDFLKSVGITTLTRNDNNAAMALGGLENGVTVYEMTAAYSAFLNNGVYSKPITYTKVLDNNGKVILENNYNRKKNIVMSESTAYLITNMLKDVVVWGTGSGARLQNGQMPSAGKTGTTDNNWDKWFVGFTPYYSAGVRYGYDKGRPVVDKGQAVKIWQAVMEKVHKDLTPKDFPEPQGIVRTAICIDSGMLPGPYCSLDPRGNRVREEIFEKNTVPRGTCQVHTPPTRICTDSNLLATDYCPLESITTKVFIVKPEPTQLRPNDSPPEDSIYGLPAGKYCNIHGPIYSD